MIYIGSLQNCQNYLEEVNSGENYQDTTTNWAEIRKKPSANIYAIPKHEEYSTEELEEVAKLGTDWEEEESWL